MTSPGRTFRVFVSSTFSDLKAERDYLQDHIYPRLRDLCQQHGCRFQAIDLRWGVSEEAALDQQTMNICAEELRRCQHTSPRPNFIVLLGQRYGWRPLPPQIAAAEFELLLSVVESVDDRVLLCCPEPPAEPQPGVHWYRRDDNADPPEYVLRPREILAPDGASKEQRARIREGEAEEWRHLESRIRRILLNAAEQLGWLEHDPRRAKYVRSATHQEIEAGALSPELERPEDHVFCFLREVADLPQDLSAAAFIDLDEHGQLDAESADLLQQLKTTLEDRLREKTPQNDGNVHIYPATWTGTGPTAEHLQTLGEDVYGCLSGVILKEVAPVERPVGDDPENRAHEAFGNQRIDVFEGRDDLVEQIRAYIDSAEPHPLVLHGVSGCGKTALVAKAAADATKTAAADAKKKIICRFVGATPASMSLRSLLEDLCRQIGPREGVLPSEIRELGQEFSKRLELVTLEQPQVLFLDALDQLGDADGARSLWWLPTTLPANVRLVVSVLDAEGGQGNCSRAISGGVPTTNLVAVGHLGAADGEHILDQWLSRAGRTLQPEQRTDVIAKFSAPGNGLPLYLKVAFEEARRWKSFDGLPLGTRAEPGLGADVQRVLKDLVGRLAREENHGPLFTERALGYLAAGRQGLTEDELIDVLSQDDDVLRNFQERSPSSPLVSRLPFIVWSRLRAEVEPYLTERQAANTTVLNFYHRQVRDAVEERCLGGDKGIRAHRELANYFHGQDSFLESIEEQRLRAKRLPPTPRPTNLRKVDELVWQRLRGQQTAEAATLLTDLFFLEAKIEAGMVFDVMLDFTEYLRASPADDSRRRHIQLLLQALRRDIHFIEGHPPTVFQCLWNSAWWYDCTEAAQHYKSAGGPWNQPGDKLSALLDAWRAGKERATPGFVWVRSKRPPPTSLWSPQLAVLRGHEDIVTSVAVTLGGARIISGSQDGTVRVWDVATGEAVVVLRGHWDRVTSVAVTPDAARIISGSQDGTVRVWDAASGVALAVLRGHEREVTSVAVTPDGARIISGSEDGTLRVWDVATGEAVVVLRGNGDWVTSVAVTPDGARIIGGFFGDGTVRVWDAATGEAAVVLGGHESSVTSVAVTPDGARIISGSLDRTVRAWDAATGAALGVWGHMDEVASVAVTPDGTRIISGSHDKTVRVWEMATNTVLTVLREHEGPVTSVVVTPDGTRIISGSWDQTVRVWDAEAGTALKVLRGHERGVTSVAVMPASVRIVSGSSDGTVRVWDAATGAALALSRRLESAVSSVAVTLDGARIIIGFGDGTVRVWDAATGEAVVVLRGHEKWVESVAVTPDGARIVSGSYDQTARVWDAATGAELAVLRGHEAMTGVAVTPDGARIISGSLDNTVRVWDTATGAELAVLRGHEACVSSVAVTPDGARIVSGSQDGTVRLWDTATGAPLGVLHGHDLGVSSVAVTPDGARIVSGSFDKTVRVWDTAAGAALSELHGHERGVTSVAVTPDGARIISGSDDNTVRVWDAATGAALVVLRGHEAVVTILAVTPDGARIISGSQDGSVGVWDAATAGAMVVLREYKKDAVLRGHEDWVTSVAVTPDGARIISGSGDGTVRVWDAAAVTLPVVLRGHKDWVTSVAVTPDRARIISGSDDNTVRVWDAATGAALAVLHGHEAMVTGVAVTPDGRRVTSRSLDNTVRVWDAASGECLEVVHGTGDPTALVAGASRFRFRALERGSKTVVEESASGREVACFSAALGWLAPYPSGRAWVGASGNHLYFITLEGDA